MPGHPSRTRSMDGIFIRAAWRSWCHRASSWNRLLSSRFIRIDCIAWEISLPKYRYCSRFLESHIESIDNEIGISFLGEVKLRVRWNPRPALVPSILRMSSRFPARWRSSDDRSLDSQRSAEKKIKFPLIQFRYITYQTESINIFCTCITTYIWCIWCIWLLRCIVTHITVLCALHM